MDKCYYSNESCSGDIWECQTCGNLYCNAHYHETDKGLCVECVACERERIDKTEDSDVDVLNHINLKLNGNKCPTLGSWGECPAISDQRGHYGNKYQVAHIYWWREPPKPLVVKEWIEECGLACYSINYVLWCDDGTNDDDNKSIVAHWDVSFGPKLEWSEATKTYV